MVHPMALVRVVASSTLMASVHATVLGRAGPPGGRRRRGERGNGRRERDSWCLMRRTRPKKSR